MTFSIIEVCALFCIAINIFLAVVLFFVWLKEYLLRRTRVKAEREYYVNSCLVQAIVSYCHYVKLKKEKKVYLTMVNDDLPQTVRNQLTARYGYKISINQLDEIVISGGDLDNE